MLVRADINNERNSYTLDLALMIRAEHIKPEFSCSRAILYYNRVDISPRRSRDYTDILEYLYAKILTRI